MGRQSAEQRLRTMTERQAVPAWGEKYQPAIRATPQEAPRVSRCSILRSRKIGREMHLLSLTEASAALLALYCPNVYDVNEQRLLSTGPACHPLQGSPGCKGLEFPSLRGTVRVAQELGALGKHPKIFLGGGLDEGMWVPLPYTGDLLLYLKNAEDERYCVNWNIKLTQADFGRRLPRIPGRTRRPGPDSTAELRHQIEEVYYRDGGIRTVRVTGDQIDRGLIANLRSLFGYHRRKTETSCADRAKALAIFDDAIGGTKTAFEVSKQVAARTGIAVEEAMVLLYQGIWHRDLKVDLFQPLLADRPLQPQRRDVIDVYAAWLGR